MVDFLMEVASAVGRPTSEGSGRTVQRIDGGLESLQASLEDLSCVPYARPRCGRRLAAECTTEVLEGIAEKFDLPEHIFEFDARPFLQERTREAFWDPASMLRDDADEVELPRVTGTTSPEELLKLAGRWENRPVAGGSCRRDQRPGRL